MRGWFLSRCGFERLPEKVVAFRYPAEEVCGQVEPEGNEGWLAEF